MDTEITIVADGSPVVSINPRIGAIILSAIDVGLGNVDNTSDLDKPVSIATLSALNILQSEINLLAPDNTFDIHTVLQSTSANWNDGYSYIVANSGIEANQQEVSTFVNTNSSNIIEVDTLVNSTSANWNTAYESLSTQTYILNDTSIRPIIGNNTSSGYYSLVSNGRSNTASGNYSIVVGGISNTASGCYSVVVNGSYVNPSTNSCNYIGYQGDDGNLYSNNSCAICIGSGLTEGYFSNNPILKLPQGSYYCIVEFGSYTRIGNNTSGPYSFIGNGKSDKFNYLGSGYYYNSDSDMLYIQHTTISGTCGSANIASGCFSSILNGYGNTVSGDYSSILGGHNNILTHSNSFILGSYIESSADDTTFVNNLSSGGNISLQGYIAIPDIEGKFWKIGVDTSGNPIGLGAL